MLDGISVFVVDDQEDTRDAIVLLLRLAGATVHACGDGAEGILQIPAVRPDVVLSDLAMPTVDGITMIRTLHGFGFDIPAIALTAHHSPVVVQEAVAAGFVRCIGKPVEPQVLLEAVQAVVRRAGA